MNNKTNFYILCSTLCVLCAQSANAMQIRPATSGNQAAATGVRGGNAMQYHNLLMMQEITAAQNDPAMITAATDAAVAALPVRVANMDLARDIATGRGEFNVGMAQLDSCAMIFPNGRFAWDRPNAGINAGNNITCVAEVEMRQIHGNSDIILARAMVAAGDAIDCNIGQFPEGGLTNAVSNVLFPMDTEPTLEYVRRRMDQEQRRNTTSMTVTSAIVGGVGGYLLNVGDNRWASTIGGAAVGGGVGLAGAQAGHVGGNVIMGAAVNAAAGGLIGNISGIGGSTLMVEPCKHNGTNTRCLVGYVDRGTNFPAGSTAFYNISNGNTRICNPPPPTETGDFVCRAADFLNIQIGGRPLNDILNDMRAGTALEVPEFCLSNNRMVAKGASSCETGNTWVQIDSDNLRLSANRINAVCVDWRGVNTKHWDDRKTDCDGKIYAFSHDGNVGNRLTVGVDGTTGGAPVTSANFFPYLVSASDGAIIDINNRARLGATLWGAGIGGLLGGIAAHQGASEEVIERWLSAVQEYRNSLEQIYCATGTRLLAPYNSVAAIPNMRQ